jgi:hypothetical protein
MSSFAEENYRSPVLSQDFESPFPKAQIGMHFVGEDSETPEGEAPSVPTYGLESPFRSVYELSDEAGAIDPEAEKAGQRVIKVDPKGASQHCSNCLTELSERWHSCPNCGVELDRDTNAAILIKKVGLDIGLLKNAQPAFARK